MWTGGPTGAYRVKDVQVRNNETGKYEPLDLTASYNLAGYNYTLRDLGDGFAMFEGAVNVLDYVMEDYMVLANYVQSFQNGEVTGYAAPAGRIKVLYADADFTAWYGEAVRYVTGKGLMSTTNGSSFSPAANVTVASVYQMLYNMEGRPAVEGLYDAGSGFSDSAATRSQVATIFAGYSAWKGVKAPAGDGSMKDKVPDYGQIPAEDLEGMTFCYYAGLMTGNQNHQLMPASPLSRAEFAQLLMTFDGFLAAQKAPAAA